MAAQFPINAKHTRNYNGNMTITARRTVRARKNGAAKAAAARLKALLMLLSPQFCASSISKA
jgi:hypothetical protein